MSNNKMMVIPFLSLQILGIRLLEMGRLALVVTVMLTVESNKSRRVCVISTIWCKTSSTATTSTSATTTTTTTDATETHRGNHDDDDDNNDDDTASRAAAGDHHEDEDKDDKRFHLRTITNPKDLRKWSKVNYSTSIFSPKGKLDKLEKLFSSSPQPNKNNKKDKDHLHYGNNDKKNHGHDGHDDGKKEQVQEEHGDGHGNGRETQFDDDDFF